MRRLSNPVWVIMEQFNKQTKKQKKMFKVSTQSIHIINDTANGLQSMHITYYYPR